MQGPLSTSITKALEGLLLTTATALSSQPSKTEGHESESETKVDTIASKGGTRAISISTQGEELQDPQAAEINSRPQQQVVAGREDRPQAGR